MRITDLLKETAIDLDAKVSDKSGAIDKLTALMGQTGCVTDMNAYKAGVLNREAEGTTGIGEGVAIPHAKSDAVRAPALAAMVVHDGVDYDALDGMPTYLFFLIAAPNTEDNVHLDVLGRLSVLLMDDTFRQSLIGASSPAAFLSVIDTAETKKFPEEKTDAAQAVKDTSTQKMPPRASGVSGLPRILAVTACPTGIAHTYMAAESLENTAKELGLTIKVETNGSGGAKNVLTPAEIAACDCIIVAADKNVEMARFDGKHVITVKVSDGISKARALLTAAAEKNAPVYHHSGHGENAPGALGGETESFGRKLYKHLMNGVSHMLPFVIGGGILIALAFLFDGANAGSDLFGSGNPFSAFLKQVGDLSFGLMLAVLSGFIAMSIGDRPALAVGFVGGLIARDGGSGFFGALFAGFIAGLLILLLRKIFDYLPKAFEGTKPVLLYPFFGILGIGAIMVFLINPPVALFNSWLSSTLSSMGETSKVLLGVVLAGMMSIDFGGPFNKAAYVFGTAAIASGQYEIMAAVMIGGMVPPIAIALCTTFFKNRFTIRERQTTVTNYIMGLAFITEGAIPFAASDPLRIIPSCVVGSALAGGLSMLFGCASRAPHGGIFVIGIIDHPLMYFISLLAGAFAGMILLALLKRPLPEANR